MTNASTSMTRRTTWMAGFALTWLLASGARAEEAAVIAVGGSPEVVASDWDAATSAVSTELARAGFHVAPEHVLDRAHAPADCLDDACLETQRTSMGAALLAVVIVWAGTDVHDRAAHVVVSLVTADTHSEATIEVEGGDTAIAARRAVVQARETMARGNRPWLVVGGTPTGAMILIDGIETAPLPWEGEVSAGHHRVEVRHHGYVTFAQEVDVAGEPVRVEATLVPEGGGGGGGGGIDVGWVIAGSASLAAGAGAIVAAVVGATTDSCTASCSGGTPAERTLTVPDETGVIAWGVTGGVLVVFGAVALGLGLASGGSSRAPVSLGPRGLTVTF